MSDLYERLVCVVFLYRRLVLEIYMGDFAERLVRATYPQVSRPSPTPPSAYLPMYHPLSTISTAQTSHPSSLDYIHTPAANIPVSYLSDLMYTPRPAPHHRVEHPSYLPYFHSFIHSPAYPPRPTLLLSQY